MEQVLEEQPRYLGENFGDFFRRTKVLSGKDNEAISVDLGVSVRTVTSYLAGATTPRKDKQQKFQEILELSNGEAEILFTVPIVKPLSPEERRARGENLGKDFAEFLSAIKFLSGKTVAELAEPLDRDVETVKSYLNGRHLPGKDVQIRVGEIFGLNEKESSVLFNGFSIEPLTSEERRARGESLGVDFAEFLATMKFLSKKTNTALASELGVDKRVIHQYLTGSYKPTKIVKEKIKSLFELNDEEMADLLSPPKINPLTPEERRARNEFLGLDLPEFFKAIKFLARKTDEEIASALGVNQTQVSAYMRSAKKPSKKTQQKIKKVFGLNDQEMESLLIEPTGKDLEKRDRQLKKNIGETSWQSYANCKDVDPDIFHPTAKNSAEELKAKNICRSCKVAKSCLKFALASGMEEGIWGGTTGEERKQLVEIRKKAS